MKQYKSSYPKTRTETSASSYTPSATEELDSNSDIKLGGSDDIGALPTVHSITEELATWSSIPERGQEAQSLTEPFAMNQEDQARKIYRPTTYAGMGTVPSTPNTEQARTSISRHLVPGPQVLRIPAIDSGFGTVAATPKLEQSRISMLRNLVRKNRVENEYILQQTFKGKSKVIGEVRAVGFSLDSKPIAVSWKDNDIMLWDLGSDSKPSLKVPLSLFKGDNCGLGAKVAISPDGKLVASGSWNSTVYLWDLGSGHGSKVLDTPKRHNPADDVWNERWVTAIVFSPDSKVVASSSKDGYLSLWRTDSGALLRTFTGNFERPNGLVSMGDSICMNFVTRPIDSLAFHPNGNLVASVSYRDIQLWNLDSDIGEPLRVLEKPKDYDNRTTESRISTIKFSPDGRLLVSGLKDGRIRLWDPQSGLLLRTAKRHSSDVSALDFSDDGKLASSSIDGTIKIWDLSSGLDLDEPLQTMKGFDNKIPGNDDRFLAFSPDAKRLMSGSQDVRAVSIWGLWPN
jgi:WD40 repeat protein